MVFTIIFTVLTFIGCASRPLVSCSSLDWFELGRRDGSSGLTPAAFQEHAHNCSGEISQKAKVSYNHGRNTGLVSYCSTDNGWSVGRSGSTYHRVCPQNFEGSFLKGFKKGQRVFYIEKEIETITQQLQVERLDFRQRYDLNQRLESLVAKLQDLKRPINAASPFRSSLTN